MELLPAWETHVLPLANLPLCNSITTLPQRYQEPIYYCFEIIVKLVNQQKGNIYNLEHGILFINLDIQNNTKLLKYRWTSGPVALKNVDLCSDKEHLGDRILSEALKLEIGFN